MEIVLLEIEALYVTARFLPNFSRILYNSEQPILFGVPQGSVLGLFLYIMYINDLPLSTGHCDIELYADDTLLYFASNDTNTIEAKMTSDLENVIQWFHSNFLVLINLSKTKIMLVGTHQSEVSYSPGL